MDKSKKKIFDFFIYFLAGLTVLFLFLKGFGFVKWDWFWVLLPILTVIGFFIVYIILELVVFKEEEKNE